MLSNVHWNETCAKQIFELENLLTRLRMENVMSTERLIGEISCLQKTIQTLAEQNEQLKRSQFICLAEMMQIDIDCLPSEGSNT